MKNLKKEIEEQKQRESFAIENNSRVSHDFAKIKLGLKTLDDAIYTGGTVKKIDARFVDKNHILNAMNTGNLEQMRELSEFYFKTSGIYARLCKYIAYLYRYDWMVTPYINADMSTNPAAEAKMLNSFQKLLYSLDNFEIKKFFGDAALRVVKDGCYYGYLIQQQDRYVVQELPANYCRTRFSTNTRPAVEFQMKYFDDMFKDAAQRLRMLNLFPKEFKKGYILYKEGKLLPTYNGDQQGWYLLDTDYAFKFNFAGSDCPLFLSVLPDLIDLDEAKELDKKRMAQKLLKLIIQKMPIDKNGDLVFDVDEAQALHNNVVQMLSKAIGIDVLTTFADVEVADVGDNTNVNAVDELGKVERAVYNEAGVSQMQFNTDGNLALEKSIANDEAATYNLILQFESFLNLLVKDFNKSPKKWYFKVQILPTTIYNYKDLAKLYKEQMQIGFSKILPQLALGVSQSSILATNYFENDVLHLAEKFVPPMTSNTMSPDVISDGDEESEGGRPELEDDEKSEKTILNEESKN